jgi:hypothetical protein
VGYVLYWRIVVFQSASHLDSDTKPSGIVVTAVDWGYFLEENASFVTFIGLTVSGDLELGTIL